jgi:hypothetical protein
MLLKLESIIIEIILLIRNSRTEGIRQYFSIHHIQGVAYDQPSDANEVHHPQPRKSQIRSQSHQRQRRLQQWLGE